MGQYEPVSSEPQRKHVEDGRCRESELVAASRSASGRGGGSSGAASTGGAVGRGAGVDGVDGTDGSVNGGGETNPGGVE